MSTSPGFILDGSVALAWSLSDEGFDYPQNVLDSLETTYALVPSLWMLEVANGLLMAERRGRSTSAQVAAALGAIGALPIVVEQMTKGSAFGQVLSLARAQKLTAHDAAYLDLAMRHGLPLATLDAALIRAAASVGVAVYSPTGM